MPQIYDMGPTALLPLRRKACWGFFRPKNPTASAGFEPANLGTKGQHATPRPPKPLLIYICGTYDLLNDCKYAIKIARIHTMRAYRNGGMDPFIHNFGRFSLEIGDLGVYWKWGWVGPRAVLDFFGKGDDIATPPGFEHRTVQPVA